MDFVGLQTLGLKIVFKIGNGVRSALDDILTRVPHGPLLFLILLNNLPNASSIILSILFADDTTLQLSSNSLEVLYLTANTENGSEPINLLFMYLKPNIFYSETKICK